MSERPKILCICDSGDAAHGVPAELAASYEIEFESDPAQAFARLAEQQYAGMFIDSSQLHESLQIGRLLQNEQILTGMPDGVCLLDPDNTIVWGNPQFRQWCAEADISGRSFYEALGNPEILGPDFCPFSTALATGQPAVPRCAWARTGSSKSTRRRCSSSTVNR